MGENTLLTYMNDPKVTRLELWRDETLTDDERVKLVEYAKTQYGIPYDYLLIPIEAIDHVLHTHIKWYHEHKHLICSTYAYNCGKSVGKIWADNDEPAPADIQDYWLKNSLPKQIVVLKNTIPTNK